VTIELDEDVVLAEGKFDDGLDDTCAVLESCHVHTHIKSGTDVFSRTIWCPLRAVLENEGFESTNGIQWAICVAGRE
jgi:hypothetical protein